MERRECETRYELAAAILPSRLRRIAMELPETDKKRAEEFRLRAGHCLSVLLPEGERSLEAIVTTEELETLCDIAAEFSRYASIETLRQGFLPVRGGFRHRSAGVHDRSWHPLRSGCGTGHQGV